MLIDFTDDNALRCFLFPCNMLVNGVFAYVISEWIEADQIDVCPGKGSKMNMIS